jgi:aspartyl-tRNA(Asn)/glutamyl-tRNA(Gln) amidotransferase subunit A
MNPNDLTRLTLREASDALRAGKTTSVELTSACLDRIATVDPVLNSFITVTGDSAMQQAEALDAEFRAGHYRGPLHGIPIALKDLIDTKGVRTTAGSAVYEKRIPDQDATGVRKLDDAGAVILGKTNLHEFAYGGSGVISHWGPVHNPWDKTRTTGGSSSGSAAAVAAGLCFAAIGTDTAGSIRLPSAYCGITGLKPTYGLVSASGVIPLCWSYDHVGPMTRTALDAAIVLDAIAGYDPEDPNSVLISYEPVAPKIRSLPKGLRVAITGGVFLTDLDPEIEQGFKSAMQLLFRVFETTPFTIEVPLETDKTVRLAEPFAYHTPIMRNSSHLYQPATLTRIKTGEGISAADYLHAREELRAFRKQSLTLWDKIDLLVSPCVPSLASKIDDLVNDVAGLRTRELRMLRNTRPFNALGTPAISVPCGVTPNGMPLALQLAAAPRNDCLLLQAANALEQVTHWKERLPRDPKW